MIRAALTLLAASALMTGCGGELPDDGPPVFEVEPSQVVPSTSGHLTISVWTAPSPPVKGVNALRFAFVDGTGGAVEAADVSATAWMPAHGHGTSVKSAISDLGAGVYEVTRIVFFMDGRWEVRGEVKGADGIVEPFVTTFDVR